MSQNKLLKVGIVSLTVASLFSLSFIFAKSHLDEFQGRPPFHIKRNSTTPIGLSPSAIQSAYNLPSNGGSGIIAIIDAYDDPNVESDLNVFSSNYHLPSCTTASGCFEKFKMAPKVKSSQGWVLEESLDTQWAHAIAPNAKILLVEAKSSSGTDLLNAVNYARSQSGVVAVSMSWGGSEFSGESAYDAYFTSNNNGNIGFFAASGDSGSGVQWPAVSVNVTGVGGTTLNLVNSQVSSETAWSGSGGGLSTYESEPSYQTSYGVPQANGFRAVPDVSYDADPSTGVSVYDSFGYQGQKGWFQVGGTSVGAPQWAAIYAIANTAVNPNLYSVATTTAYSTDFRDITQGNNGSCGFYCTAGPNYDYVTGLGSPLTTSF